MQRLRRALLTWLGLVAVLGVSIAPRGASADPLPSWTAGPGAAGDNTYAGFVDAPTANASVSSGSLQVIGWFVDTTAQGWAGADDVQVFKGTMDGGGTLLGHARFAQSRPDVASALGNPYWAASGFTASIAASAIGTGGATISIYAHTPGKGWWLKQVSVNVATGASAAPAPAPAAAPVAAPAAAPTGGGGLPIVAFEKPKDSEEVLTKNDYEIAGYALDRNAAPNQGASGSGVDRVQVYLGGQRDSGGTYLGDAALGYSDGIPAQLYGGQFGYSGWRLTFKPTQFHVNTYILYAYARSVVTGREDNVQRFFSIRDTT